MKLLAEHILDRFHVTEAVSRGSRSFRYAPDKYSTMEDVEEWLKQNGIEEVSVSSYNSAHNPEKTIYMAPGKSNGSIKWIDVITENGQRVTLGAKKNWANIKWSKNKDYESCSFDTGVACIEWLINHPGKKLTWRVISDFMEIERGYRLTTESLEDFLTEAISSGRFRSELPELGCTLEEITGWLDSKDATGYWWNDTHSLALPSKSSRKLNYLVGPWVKRDREQQWILVTNCYDQRVRLNPNIDQECKFSSKAVKDDIVLNFNAAVKLVDQMLKNPEKKFYIEDINPLVSEAISSGRTKSEKSVVPDNFKTKTVTDWLDDLGIPFNNSKVWSLRNWYYCMDPNSKSGNSVVVSFPITSRQSFIFRLYIDRSNDIYYCKQEFGEDVEYNGTCFVNFLNPATEKRYQVRITMVRNHLSEVRLLDCSSGRMDTTIDFTYKKEEMSELLNTIERMTKES